ncbi:MAG: hypothetical protein AAF433_15845 [Bacteroidota bacterium]
MIVTLTYISLIAGGLLVALLLLSLIGGLDLDFDFDAPVDADAGGVGILKGGLTFISIGSWVVKLVLVSSANPTLAFTAGIIAGLIAVLLMAAVLRFMLKQQEETNWSPGEAMFKTGKVYLRIPAEGTGIIQVNINGTQRELKARSKNHQLIPTGAIVLVEDVEGDQAVVSEQPKE